jgi:pimeloyl-ACP methyl ester carboxylesterase
LGPGARGRGRHGLPVLTRALVSIATVALGCGVTVARSADAPAPAGSERATPEPQLASAGVPRLERAECVTEALRALDARCFTFVGPEDWDEPGERQVRLPVAVIAPEGEPAPGPPVVFFPGGPGYSILDHGEYIARLRRDIGPRTLIVLDHRGFVHAEPSLRCPDYADVSPYHDVFHTPALTASADPMERMEAIVPVVERCHAKLEAEGVAIEQYNSWSVSRDVDALRRLLGHERIDVFGSSTGSGTALLYLGYFPESVRAAVFGWPWYNQLRNRPFVDEFRTAKQTFTDALALCVEDDARCRALVPDWLRVLDRARRRLDAEPFVATVDHDGEERALIFDGAAFLDTLYLTLPEDHGRLASLARQVAAGDYRMLPSFFRVADYRAHTEAPRYALGYFLAHVCGDMGASRPTRADAIAAIRREPAVLGFEPPWLCAWWGSDGDVPAEHLDPVRSRAPALAIHGQLDPCCGTRWSERVRETMPALQIVELQVVGHSPTTDCRSRLIAAFLADPGAPVDASCRDEVPLGPWHLEPPRSDGPAGVDTPGRALRDAGSHSHARPRRSSSSPSTASTNSA